MTNSEKTPVTFQELLVSSLAQTDALSKLLIEKGVITQQEFLQKIAEERDAQTNAAVGAAGFSNYIAAEQKRLEPELAPHLKAKWLFEKLGEMPCIALI